MPIEDSFSISGRGTVATGRVSRDASPGSLACTDCLFKVERGTANKGDEIEIVGFGSKIKTTLIGIGL